jgi:predicted nucleic acid-binding protein
MLIHLDTSVLVDSFAGARKSMPAVLKATADGEVVTFSTLVLYEWLRGPRHSGELEAVERLFAREFLPALGEREARTAAKLYRSLTGSRHRHADIAIAACAIENGAAVWTLNPKDFEDIPGLTLYAG